MYGRKASELVREFASSEHGQLSSFNKELFDQVIEECNDHFHHLEALIRKVDESKSKDPGSPDGDIGSSEDEMRKRAAEKKAIQEAIKSDEFGALVHHVSLVRNKRCLMAYIYNRAETIRSLGWMCDRVIPPQIEQKLDNNNNEKLYFEKHTATLQSYMGDLDLDLKVDMIPPKDPYIKVRVLDDIGDGLMLGDQTVNLARHAIMFLRRTDAEQYITQGQMEELTG